MATTLSYSSLKDLAEFFTDRFGLPIAPADHLTAVCEAVEIRNVSVHNRCIINTRFVGRMRCNPSCLGQKKQFFIGYHNALVPLLAELVKMLDKKARAKLKLKAIRFRQKKPANNRVESISPPATRGEEIHP